MVPPTPSLGGGCAPRTSRLRRLWTCYGTGIFLIFITVLTSSTKKKYIQPTNILLVMWSISQLLWLKPTRRHISEKSWMYRWLNRSARFCDAPAQWFTLGPTSCAWFLDKKCDQLTDMQTRLRPTPQAGRSVATFDLRWPVTALSVVSLGLVCMLVSWSHFSSRNQLAHSVGLTMHFCVGIIFGIPTPTLRIYYTTIIRLRWWFQVDGAEAKKAREKRIGR